MVKLAQSFAGQTLEQQHLSVIEQAWSSFGSDLVWWIERTALLVIACVVLVALIAVGRFVRGYNDARDRRDG